MVYKNEENQPYPYNSVYVYFEHWYNTESNQLFQQEILDPKVKSKVTYSNNWYWTIFKNTLKEKKENTPYKRKIRVVIDNPTTPPTTPISIPVLSRDKPTFMEIAKGLDFQTIALSNNDLTDEEQTMIDNAIYEDELNSAKTFIKNSVDDAEATCLINEILREDDDVTFETTDSTYIESIEYENLYLRTSLNSTQQQYAQCYQSMYQDIEMYKAILLKLNANKEEKE